VFISEADSTRALVLPRRKYARLNQNARFQSGGKTRDTVFVTGDRALPGEARPRADATDSVTAVIAADRFARADTGAIAGSADI